MLFSNNGDIFKTQADTRFNSFSDPINAVNMNPGQWGVDPNYMTPAYLSPFRPRYQGPTGQNYSGFRPSWATSVNQVFNPMAPGGENYGGNFIQQNSPYYDTIFQKPSDGAASFAQNWVIPALASFGAFKYLGSASTKIGQSFGRNMLGGLFAGAGMGYQATSIATRAGRFAGGIAGGLLLPALAAEGAVSAVDSAIFDPYISQRRMGRDLRENFGGVTFGEGFGDLYAGGGLSRKAAQGIATRVSQAGARDRTFTQEETRLLTDYASRAGMLDNAMPEQMAQRFEGILKQVKLVMSVANTSDFKETIEIMSKLQMAGVSGTQAAGLMGQLGGLAAMGGHSVQKLLNTVGMQGQLMFAAGGLTPYVGQAAGFGAMSTMSAAYRSGLISPAMMARMGGQEGAAQSAVAAQIAAFRTPYAGMMANNAFFGRGETGSVIGNVSRFGAGLASDPLKMIGRHLLSEGALASRHAQDQGIFGVERQILQIARARAPQSIGPNGEIDAGVAYMIMVNDMGMTSESAQAMLQQIHATRDPRTNTLMLNGLRRGSIDMLMKYQQQEGLNKGIFTTPYNAVKTGMMKIQEAGAGIVGDLNEGVAGVADYLESIMNTGFFRIKPGENQVGDFTSGASGKLYQANLDGPEAKKTISSMMAIKSKQLGFQTMDSSKLGIDQIQKINRLARDGNQDAIKFLDPSVSSRERQNALSNLSRAGLIKKEYSSSAHTASLLDIVDQLGVTLNGEGVDNESTLRKNFEQLHGRTADDKLETLNLMYEGVKSDGNLNDEKRKRLASLLGQDPESLTNAKISELSKEGIEKAGKNRLLHLVGMSGVGSTQGLVDKLKERGDPALFMKMEHSGDIKAMLEQVEAQKGLLKERQNIIRMAREGKISTNEAMGAITSLDNKEIVGKFDKAVQDFANAVDTMKGGDKGSAQNVPSVFDVWFKGAKPVRSYGDKTGK